MFTLIGTVSQVSDVAHGPLVFLTAPTARHKSKMADKEKNGEKNLASEGPRPGKNLSKQTEKARQKSGLLFRLLKIISYFT